jgi:ubiquinone/menaquinone biosynthesis C-methylase UbiE
MTLYRVNTGGDDKRNTYLNDPESGGEMARLLDQDRTLTAAMGGLLPERDDIEQMRDVLDVACGPGGWVQELAFSYPHLEVTGIDISKAMIEYAQMQSRTRHLENATFVIMDATMPLDFMDNSFDLVNARTIAGFMKKRAWPDVIGECVRVLRPGGVLRMTETDLWGTTNSPAFSTLLDLSYQAIWLDEHSFDASRHSFGITSLLERFQREAGLEDIDHRAHAVNFSSGAPAYQAMYNNFQVFFKLIQPFMLRIRDTFADSGIPPQEELDRLYMQMLQEMIEPDFAGIFYLLTVWGRRPR